MSDKPKNDPTDDVNHAALEEVFPSASEILAWAPKSLAGAFPTADIVLDTNVLLLPYVAGKDSLESIIKVYATLAGKKRVFIPGRVIREFAKNRPLKIADILKSVMDQKSKVAPPTALQFPLLEGLPAIQSVRDAEAALAAAQRHYVSALEAVHETALAWGWNDPVSESYRETFASTECVVECALTPDEVEKRRSDRYRKRIPPGYKDQAKDDGGVGDLLIWLTILQLGMERKRDLIFVTGEEKADWQHRANNRGFLPRSELLDEYRRATGGRTFFLLPLSTLLELMKADAAMVETVRKEEKRQRLRALVAVPCPECSTETECRLGELVGDSAVATCRSCSVRFHVHRTATGVRTQLRGARRTAVVDEMVEWFRRHYMDPVEGVPFESAGGGYQYVNGGPFDASGVLTAQFRTEHPESWIEEAVARIELDGTEWVRRGDY